ncbi:MAG: VCBS repeat-containing protein [Planctomycetes bacterium]|nr:VCBS repeat-containing protein [Planctomycetota bacterium]
MRILDFGLAMSLACTVSIAQQAAQTDHHQFRTSRFHALPAWPISHYNSATADVNKDGLLDILIAADYGGVLLWINDGTGGFRDETKTRIPNLGPRVASTQIDAADVDADGDLDLIIANDTDFPNSLLLNNGSGVFADMSQNFPANAQWTSAQVVFDADGDGDTDVFFVSGSGKQSHQLFLNDGTGKFRDASSGLPNFLPYGLPVSIVAVDLDNDGDLDLLCESPVLVVENVGNARFALSTKFQVPGGWTAKVADFDSDGIQDVFYAGITKRLLFGKGAGTYLDVTKSHMPASWTTDEAAIADLDGDGDMDVVAARMLWLNDGSGRLVDASIRMPLRASMHLGLIGDFDADGDADIVHSYAKHVAVNLHHHLDADEPPSVGGMYALHVHAKPGYADRPTPSILLFAPKLGRLGLGKLGILGLDPVQTMTAGAVNISTTRAATFPVPIPANAQLRGVQLCYQPLFLDAQPRLGNVLAEFIQ